MPHRQIPHFKKALFVFPHPDDEVFGCGGLISILSGRGCEVTLCVLTRGEAGGPNGVSDESLAIARVKELQMSAKVLGVSSLIQKDFGDGCLISKEATLKEFIVDLVESDSPELVVTYDLSGLYGHEDHITTSKVVTEVMWLSTSRARLWYLSFPPSLLKMVKLPEHMAKDSSFKDKRSLPTHKINVGWHMLNKITALYAHKSQHYSIKKSMPFGLAPLWLNILSFGYFEYFHEVSDGSSPASQARSL